jgi:hypothetical protein
MKKASYELSFVEARIVTLANSARFAAIVQSSEKVLAVSPYGVRWSGRGLNSRPLHCEWVIVFINTYNIRTYKSVLIPI